MTLNLPTTTRTSILFNPPLTFEDAQALAAALARNTHATAHVVLDCGRYLVCSEADVGVWGLDDVQWSCEAEDAYFTDELEVTSL